MTSGRPRTRRLLIPALLAAILAAEVTGMAIARSLEAAAEPAVAPAADQAPAIDAPTENATTGGPGLVVRTRPTTPGLRLQPSHTVAPLPQAIAVKPKPRSKPATASSPTSASFQGRNHVWIPALRISQTIQSFPCSRSRPPDAGVYRWGCAGRNNVYLMSHAWSTFKPLHDAYVAGRMKKGMKVWYADGSGTVHAYRVSWWRLTAPTTAASWAWASLSRPGMTLQTCVGANSQYRLMVRLVRIG
jgi:hypothetical protein